MSEKTTCAKTAVCIPGHFSKKALVPPGSVYPTVVDVNKEKLKAAVKSNMNPLAR
jgi:hypothetical protein